MYVTLTSNASKNVYGDANRAGSFRNVLSQSINFEKDEWEVGVKKLIYRNNFKTIVNEKFEITAMSAINVKKSGIGQKSIIGDYFTFTNGKLVINKNLPPQYKLQISPLLFFKLNKKEEKNLHNLFLSTSAHNDVVFEVTPEAEYDFIMGDSLLTSSHYIIECYVKSGTTTYSIQSGNYASVQAILDKINKESGNIKFFYKNGHVNVEIAKKKEKRIFWTRGTTVSQEVEIDLEYITLLNGLQYVLGFEETVLKSSTIARFRPQLHRGLFAIFIYSNICKYSHVGDTRVPLLNVISMPKSEFGNTVSIDVSDPMYVPVAYTTVDDIEIKLASDTGEELAFDNENDDASKSVITLHFRKRHI